MKPSKERRRFPRVPLNLLVQFRVSDMEAFMREYGSNISAGGMFIRCQNPFPKETMVYLQFRTAAGAKLIEGLGKVVHVNPSDTPTPGMGIEFVNLDEESQALVDQIVRARLAELE